MKLSAPKRIVIFAIVGFLFVLSMNFFQREVRGFFYSISSPIQKAFWRAGGGASDFIGAIFEVQNLKKENQEFNLMAQELFFLQNSLKELTEENKILREAFGMGLQGEFRLEFAEIIGKDINQDSLLIDKGSKDGISRGLFVITSQKVLIGKVQDVYRDYSRVLLISDKESSFEAQISGSDISGLVKGSGRLRTILDFIPREKEIKEGDLVVSGKFLVGLVKEVKKIDVDPFQKAEISPFLDISNLDKVFIALD